MQKYKTLIIFLLLIFFWSIFFSTTKFFLWGDLKGTLNVSLQTIAGYLSLGAVISYLIGGALASTFLKKYLLFTLSFLTLLFITAGYIFGFTSNIYFGVTMIFVGMFYGAWSVVKNVIISIEIEKTGLPDTKINAFASVVFIVAIIFGSILGGLLFEKMANTGYLVIIFILLISAILGLFLDYDEIAFKSLLHKGIKYYVFERKMKFKNAMKLYLPELKYIFKHYALIIISAGFLWAISTIVSQKAIEYSIINFNKSESQSALILLYSALGVILGSLVSIKMEKDRWKYFIINNFIFGILVILFPFFSKNYIQVSIMAFAIGFFFGIASNLLDAYFFKTIGEENRKEYGSSTYGLIVSLVVFIMMFSSNIIEKYSPIGLINNNILKSPFSQSQTGYDVLMLFLGFIIILITYIIYINKIKRGK